MEAVKKEKRESKKCAADHNKLSNNMSTHKILEHVLRYYTRVQVVSALL